MRHRNNKLILFFILFITANVVRALPDDKTQPVHVTSNTLQVNKAKGISVFQGKVTLTQGTSILLADTVTTHTDSQNQLIEADAVGNLANFSNLPDLNKPRFVAVAQTIQYFPKKNEIVLIGNAKASQGPNSYTAPRIEYYIDKQMVTSANQGRTTIVIQPQSLGQQKSKTP